MSLVTRTLLALEIGHRDLTNRVCLGHVCLLDESKRAAPLQPRGMLIVRSMNSGLAVVERVTAGRPDGCWYVLLEFRINPIAD